MALKQVVFLTFERKYPTFISLYPELVQNPGAIDTDTIESMSQLSGLMQTKGSFGTFTVFSEPCVEITLKGRRSFWSGPKTVTVVGTVEDLLKVN